MMELTLLQADDHSFSDYFPDGDWSGPAARKKKGAPTLAQVLPVSV